MPANADLITVETYVQQGKTIENQFFIYGPKCKTNVYFGYLGGSGGPSMNSYPLIHKIWKQSDKNWPKNNQTGPILSPISIYI